MIKGELQVAILLIALFLPLSFVQADKLEGGMNMKLTSPSFTNNAMMPKKFTCEGDDVSPELIIEGMPLDAISLALIVDDPDAPMGTWVHWVVFNITLTKRIEENSVPGIQGITNSGKKDYHGPCPPSGTHRYFFKIYALDKELDLPAGASKGQLEKAMQAHILDQAQLIGLYKREGR